jgi:hypothetical protein
MNAEDVERIKGFLKGALNIIQAIEGKFEEKKNNLGKNPYRTNEDSVDIAFFGP